MSNRPTVAARAGWALAALAVLLAPAIPVAAAPLEPTASPETYAANAYSDALSLPPTNSESQSKLWWHDQQWWGLVSEPGRDSTVRVHRLMPDHTWEPTPAVTATNAFETGDAYKDADDNVHVVTRHNDGGMYYTALTYAAGEYTARPPQLITIRGGQSPATITEDSVGRLWVGWATPYDVSVAWSDDGRTWTPIMLADTGTGRTQEAAAIISYGKRVGLMWSDQGRDTVFFASHRAGDVRTNRWPREVALTGPGQADNHISLVRVPQAEGPDVLAAAVKTSLGDQGEAEDSPLIKVLLREPDGTWSQRPAGTVADRLNDPMLQVDATSGTLYLLASFDGRIVSKATPVDDIRFEPGPGSLFVLDSGGVMSYPTGSKEPVTERTGFVVLASDISNRIYRHAEMPVLPAEPAGPDPEDVSPPDRPSGLLGRAATPDTAVLSWSPAQDRDRWVPASDGTPAAGYVVFREGVEISTVQSTTVTDSPRTVDEATEEMTVTYQVAAVDASGNRSRAREVTVTLPAAQRVDVPLLAGIAALIAASGLGAWAMRRLWLTQRPSPPEPVPPRPPVRDKAEAGARG